MTAPVRRASYGPRSPLVGERGARTRQLVLDTTLDLFSTRGFHATLVDDIARSADISRATLYQYFASKEELFTELVEESGAALLRVVRRLRPLGPTAEGFDNLHWWLGEWAWVFDRYSTMFVQWANVDSPSAPLRAKLSRFVEGHTTVLAKRIEESGFDAVPAPVMAVCLLGVVERYNYVLHLYQSRMSLDRAIDQLAQALQLTLFPQTPDSVLLSGPTSGGALARPPRTVGRFWRPRSVPGTRPPGHAAHATRLAGLSTQARTTVDALLEAGSVVFSANGYTSSSVDQVVRQAGLARGTFYKYFDDKLDLLVALGHECAEAHRALYEDFAATVSPGPEVGRQLRAWLPQQLEVQTHHGGVIRAWTEGIPNDPRVDASAQYAAAHVFLALRSVSGRMQSVEGLDIRAVGLIVMGLTERFPTTALGTCFEPTSAEILETQAVVLERAVFTERARRAVATGAGG